MMNQKEGTYMIVAAVLKEAGKTIDPAKPTILTPEERATCIYALIEAFAKKEIQLKTPQKNMKTYVGGLLSNWLNKDKRLNGGVKFELKKPGSRAHLVPDDIRELRKLSVLMKGTENEEKVAKILEEREAEYRVSREKKDINVDLLPAELRALVS